MEYIRENFSHRLSLWLTKRPFPFPFSPAGHCDGDVKEIEPGCCHGRDECQDEVWTNVQTEAGAGPGHPSSSWRRSQEVTLGPTAHQILASPPSEGGPVVTLQLRIVTGVVVWSHVSGDGFQGTKAISQEFPKSCCLHHLIFAGCYRSHDTSMKAFVPL